MNRSAADRLGVGIGSRIQIPGESLRGRFSDTVFEPQVVGIVEDFHFKSLHERVGPIVLGFHSNPVDVIDYFAVRVDGQNITRSLEHLREVGERYDPRHPFEFNFLDERLADFYEAETRLGNVFSLSTILAVLIACLGLFGLAALTTAHRIKEIGVRKVLGASASNIVVLLSKDILTLVGVSFVIAGPISYLLMDKWLQAFAYRTDIGVGVLVVALALSMTFAMITVSYHSIRASTTDPVESLRYE